MRTRSWNCGNGSDDEVRDGLDRLASRVISLQEAGDRERLVIDWAKDNDRHVIYRDIEGASSVPILTRGWPEKSGTVLAVPARYVGAGAGPSRSKPKVINWVRMGGWFVVNTHLIASATRAGREYDARRRHYRDHIGELVGLVSKMAGPVLINGDFNAPPDFGLLDPLRKAGFTQIVTEPTHDVRTIDHIWVNEHALPSRVLDMPGDHRSPGARRL